ncbi:multiple C2 and transmembrane domain-containing protein-like [Pararge aegeria]|uniref:multiple C2 and transmembrane domain-containing protein-like n=1 Tax=Pararge aegeria TaxID=116150 RepID=UPI0019D31AC7|nr:multiple C2 and transmembrane domain-containing protein-like [Pararge aegeria]
MDTKALHPIYQKQFAKLHEKIQNKYDEMQKKLEKSRSIDALTTLNGDYDYKQKKYDSVCDLSKVVKDLYTSEIGTKGNLQAIAFQDNHKEVTFQEIIFKESFVTETDSLLSISDKFDSENEVDSPINNNHSNHFFGSNDFKTSLESLNDTKESDGSSEPITPINKSLRSKIKSKLKKRQKEKELKEKEKQNKKESRDKVEKYILSNTTKYNIVKTSKKNKVATVTMALIEVTGLDENVDEKTRVLLFRFRLGAEKRKSKIVKSDSTPVKFQELFNFNLLDDEYLLEITLWDKELLIGRSLLDLSQFEKEKTHKMQIHLEGEIKEIEVLIVLTISGTTMLNTVFNDSEYEKKKREYLLQHKYTWYRLCDDFSNVGFLQVIVYGAKGLSGQDCFCILKLDHQRVQTQTDYKTNDPSWMKIFSFTVTDITSILEVIIVDEKKCEEVGRISKPLLKIQPGKKWYALKDSLLKERARGQNPRILIEFNVAWNLFKGAIRVLNPKEPNYLETDEKLDRHIFAKNLTRAKAVTTWIINTFKIYKTCFEWESMKLNVVSLIIWLAFCFYAEMWMMPLLLLIPFFWYKPEEYTILDWKTKLMHEIGSDSSADSKTEKEEKNPSLLQKINSLQEIIQSIQNIIGKVASTGESIKNLFNFTVPFVSCLAIFLIIVIAFVMYLIPFNYICMMWAVNKFVKKIFRPNRIRNNEMMDLLSRVPDDETLIECEDLPLGHISDDNEN